MLTLLVALLAIFTGCEDKSAPGTPPSAADLFRRGRSVYVTQCISCHNPDPRKPGAVGPEVFGASKELLEARVLRAEYPAGYKPKRETHVMQKLPHLKNELDALHAFLNQTE